MPFSLNSEQKQTVLWLAVGLVLAALLVKLGPVLAPFIAAGVLAYALNPTTDWLSSRQVGKVRMPRVLAVVIVMLLLLAAILALVLVVLPVMQKQIPLLQEQLPYALSRLNAALAPKLQELGIRVRLDGIGIKRIVSQYFATSGDEIWSTLLASAKVGGIAMLGWLATLSLIPVALFYLLLDWHAVVARMHNLIPRRWVGRATGFGKDVDGLLAQYLRGQLAVMLILAVYYSAALAIAGFDVAVPVGILTGILIFIPYLGFGLGLVLALIAAILQFEGLHGLLLVAGIYGTGQVIEGFFLTPRLVGERIGLPPLAVIFALLAFGHLFGFVGVLLALPASAIVAVAFRHLRTHYINSSFYRQT
ncbi:MAG TPA: AI-2E family transporter [Noviherbaspirillum sp.]|uniref:AI-2E family transporter n=1 Tax=Noviherbaspirillum sp. TaxID=1926288 RepID=UPI002B49425B|nr:AI-2E family transporter [Noviherbaspirillum sp.]HJV83987.1 AI-2E family transporter [Noviherbaspirillum sp.]